MTNPITFVDGSSFPVALRIAAAGAHRLPRRIQATRASQAAIYRVSRRIAKVMPEATVVATLPSGAVTALPMSDHDARHTLLTRQYEPDVQEFARLAIAPSTVVLDVGANIGLHTAHFAHLVGAEGHVHAFEPGRAAEWLRCTVLLNEWSDRVSVHPTALAAEAGLRPFYRGPGVGLINTLEMPSSLHVATEEVMTATLDDLVLPLLHERPSLMKLDVEGAEMAVLRGGKALFARFPPRFLIVEFTSATDGVALLRALHDLRYHAVRASGAVLTAVDPAIPERRFGGLDTPGFVFRNVFFASELDSASPG